MFDPGLGASDYWALLQDTVRGPALSRYQTSVFFKSFQAKHPKSPITFGNPDPGREANDSFLFLAVFHAEEMHTGSLLAQIAAEIWGKANTATVCQVWLSPAQCRENKDGGRP